VLKKLAKRRFDPDKAAEVINEINSGSHRSVAIVWGAIVEEALEDSLSRAMKHLTRPEKELLFERNGPLATFSSKIIIAYRIQILDKVQQSYLNRIRHVRNAFAHGLYELTFATKEVHDVCRLLSIAQSARLTDPKACYCIACLRLWTRLSEHGGVLSFAPGKGRHVYVGHIKWEWSGPETP
jgi:hypothetical protein